MLRLPADHYRRMVAPGLLILLSFAAAGSWLSDGIVYQLVRQDLSATERIGTLKLFFAGFGIWAPLVYLAMVTVEVIVAPLPGLMLYAPGGILFGPLIGGSLALAGNIIGAGIACRITRSLGGNRLDRLFSQEQLRRLHTAVEKRGPWLIFLLRVNPLTSSDIISYAAGLTRIPVWKVMLATGTAMTPLCFGQAWLARGLLDAFPQLVYPLIACCIVYLVVCFLVVRRIMRQTA